jgi:hypothetical protein
MIRRIVLSCCFVLLSLPLLAMSNVTLNPDHPQHYKVVKGDTLWDISGLFLQYPWHWPDIWHVNPQIDNPHLIYPGDILTLTYRDGSPMLELTRGPVTYKMSPQMRETALQQAIPTIPLDALKPFLSRPSVVGPEVLENAPYVVASSEERLISGAGDIVYVKGINAEDGKHYSLFRGDKVYTDPDTGEILGYQAIYIADAWLSDIAEISTAELRETSREVLIGDRLMAAVDDQYEANFYPHLPKDSFDGKIISVFDGVSQVGQYQLIVLNRGQRENLEVGHALSVYQAGDIVKDSVSEDLKDTVTLPDEYSGVALVFKVFEKVSYAIVMKANRAIHVGDRVSAAD